MRNRLSYIRYRQEAQTAPTQIPRPGSIPKIIVPKQQVIQTVPSILEKLKCFRRQPI